jgi:hypothetical protein
VKEEKEISGLTGVITIETRKFCFSAKETAFSELSLKIPLDIKSPVCVPRHHTF